VGAYAVSNVVLLPMMQQIEQPMLGQEERPPCHRTHVHVCTVVNINF